MADAAGRDTRWNRGLPVKDRVKAPRVRYLQSSPSPSSGCLSILFYFSFKRNNITHILFPLPGSSTEADGSSGNSPTLIALPPVNPLRKLERRSRGG